jgi:hypothetical protein
VLRGYAAGAKPKINYLRAAQGCLFSRVLAPLAMQFAAAQKQTNTFIPSTTIVTQPRNNKHCVAFGDGVNVDIKSRLATNVQFHNGLSLSTCIRVKYERRNIICQFTAPNE